MNYVWYACYGSNINRERFMRYINWCSDTTPPMEDRPWEAEDGLTNGAISEATHLGDDKERKVIESLLKLGVVRQNWKSWELEADDEGAVFYIERDERELVDRIRALKREAGCGG